MTLEAVKEFAKSLLPAYLSGKGIDIKRPFRCLSASHTDCHPSMSYRPKTNTVQCYGCGEHGDIFDVIRMEYGLAKGDYPAIFAKTYQVLGIEPEQQRNFTPMPRNKGEPQKYLSAETNYTDFFREATKRIEETDYARRRKINLQFCRMNLERYDDLCDYLSPKSPPWDRRWRKV